MSAQPHESIGSDMTGPPSGVSGAHESVSGGEEIRPDEVGDVSESTSFEGTTASLESVEGFSPLQAFGESLLSETVEIAEDESDLPSIESLVFEEPETVCGRDDRVRITPATQVPWRWICELLITTGDGRSARGTGWFIGPRTVMTAGHVVYGRATGGWARSIEVIPGMDGASRPFGSQVGTSFRSVNGWVNDASAEYDYGAIILPNSNLGNTVGWFGFAVVSDAGLLNLLVNNSGYPGDRPFGTQWFNAGTITRVTARRLFYMIDTFGGQSGSPIWRLQNGVRHGVGIHGYGGCPNGAVRIITPVFNNMLTWRNNP